jgi:hypothetical protein
MKPSSPSPSIILHKPGPTPSAALTFHFLHVLLDAAAPAVCFYSRRVCCAVVCV